MRRGLGAAVSLLLLACGPAPGPLAKVWTPREFLARQAVTAPIFGGWAPAELLVTEGQPIPFSRQTQGPKEGLTVFPGVSEGRALGFIIVDLWQDHPEPWVQPVWVPATATAPHEPRPRAITLFPVGLDSTFYSPWWRMQLVPVEDGVTLTTSKEVLDRRVLPPGPLVLCPVVSPGTVGVAAAAGERPRHPLTGAPLVTPEHRGAFVDGATVTYLELGAERAPFDGQRLLEAELFVFVRGGAPLPVAAVWPPAPRGHGFLRRVEVPVPPGAAFFVPAARPDLRAPLGELAPMVSPALDGFTEYALRLARDPACFEAATFPAACDWLDTHEKVRALPGAVRRPVQLTAAVLEAVAP